MGYFSNGTAGMLFEEQYCQHCIHEGPPDGPGCAVMLAHVLHNYPECNNADSILHLLIPLDDNGCNKKCLMFVAKGKTIKGPIPKHLELWAKAQGLVEVER